MKICLSEEGRSVLCRDVGPLDAWERGLFYLESNVVDDGPRGAAPLMPASHEGRFDDLGAPGCYGCHGSSEQANPLLATAPALPEDHYADGTSASREINPVRAQCNTCHGQG